MTVLYVAFVFDFFVICLCFVKKKNYKKRKTHIRNSSAIKKAPQRGAFYFVEIILLKENSVSVYLPFFSGFFSQNVLSSPARNREIKSASSTIGVADCIPPSRGCAEAL